MEGLKERGGEILCMFLMAGGRGAACAGRSTEYVGPERPVHISDDEKDHRERVNVTCATKTCEHIFVKIIDVVCLTVVSVEENLIIFPLSQII